MTPAAGKMCAVPMRQDCKYFESRTYANGETVRKCDLDLAPEAPWRCPDDCPRYEPRLADVELEPRHARDPADARRAARRARPGRRLVAALLDEAEDIVNAAGPRSWPRSSRARAGGASGAAGGAGAAATR